MNSTTLKSTVLLVASFALFGYVCLDAQEASAQIKVVHARIGCLDVQRSPNLTNIVRQRCNGKMSCSFKAPTPAQYRAWRVNVRTRSFCTQAMDITYQCGKSRKQKHILVPGDAWKRAPARLLCPKPSVPKRIKVVHARIGCLDVQRSPNLTNIVRKRCDGKTSCSFKAPTPAQYRAWRISVRTRSFCTQAMDITYQCGSSRKQKHVLVPGDAWKRPPARLTCR